MSRPESQDQKRTTAPPPSPSWARIPISVVKTDPRRRIGNIDRVFASGSEVLVVRSQKPSCAFAKHPSLFALRRPCAPCKTMARLNRFTLLVCPTCRFRVNLTALGSMEPSRHSRTYSGLMAAFGSCERLATLTRALDQWRSFRNLISGHTPFEAVWREIDISSLIRFGAGCPNRSPGNCSARYRQTCAD